MARADCYDLPHAQSHGWSTAAAASCVVQPVPVRQRRRSLYRAMFATEDVPDGAFAAPLRPVYPHARHDRRPGCKAGRNVLPSENRQKTARRPHPVTPPASHPESGDLSPAFACQSRSSRRRDALPPVAVPAPLCGWWYRGRYEKWGHQGTTARASVQAVRCPAPRVPGAWNRRKGTGAAPDADCHSGDSANAVAPDAACSSDRNVGIRQSSRSRGTVAQAQNPDD